MRLIGKDCERPRGIACGEGGGEGGGGGKGAWALAIVLRKSSELDLHLCFFGGVCLRFLLVLLLVLLYGLLLLS